MDIGIEWCGNHACAGWEVGEERGLRVWIGEVIVGVDVCEVCWVGEVAVEKARKKKSLDFGREEIWDDVKTCLPSGQVSTKKGMSNFMDMSRMWSLTDH